MRGESLGWVVARGWQRRPAEQRQNDEGESPANVAAKPKKEVQSQEAQVGEKDTPRRDGAEEEMTQTAARERWSRQEDKAEANASVVLRSEMERSAARPGPLRASSSPRRARRRGGRASGMSRSMKGRCARRRRGTRSEVSSSFQSHACIDGLDSLLSSCDSICASAPHLHTRLMHRAL